MVVELIDAAVTLVAMTRPWGSKELALEAEGCSIVNFQQLQEFIILYFSADVDNLVPTLALIKKSRVLL